MYKALTKEDWLKEFRLKASEAPKGVLTYGGWNMQKALKIASKLLKNIYRLEGEENIVFGKFMNKRVMIASTYGAPMTSEMVHIGAKLGAKIAVHVGSFGALQSGMKPGDILLPTWAFRDDGASNWYLPKKEKADCSKDVISWLEKECKERNLKFSKGKIYTTTAMLAETWKDIVRWKNEGYFGVDLEVATAYAVAKHFGIKRIAILRLIDNLVEKHHVLMLSEKEKKEHDRIRKLTLELGLEVINKFG